MLASESGRNDDVQHQSACYEAVEYLTLASRCVRRTPSDEADWRNLRS